MATGGNAPYADLPNWNKPLGQYDLQNLGDAIANKLSGQEKRAFAKGAVEIYQREDLNEFAEILKTFMKTRDDLKDNASYENCAGVVSWIKVKGGENGGTATIGDLYALLETAAGHQKMRFAEILREGWESKELLQGTDLEGLAKKLDEDHTDGTKSNTVSGRPGVEIDSGGTDEGGPRVRSVDLPNWDDPLGHYVLEKLGDLIATKLDGPQKQCFAQEAVMEYQNEDKNRYAEILKTFMEERDNLKAKPTFSNCAGVIIWMEQKAGKVTIGDLYKLLEKTTKHPKKELTEVLRKARK